MFSYFFFAERLFLVIGKTFPIEVIVFLDFEILVFGEFIFFKFLFGKQKIFILIF